MCQLSRKRLVGERCLSKGHAISVFANTCPLQTAKHFFLKLFTDAMSNSLQASIDSIMKNWPDKCHVWGTPTRSHLTSNSQQLKHVFLSLFKGIFNIYTCLTAEQLCYIYARSVVVYPQCTTPISLTIHDRIQICFVRRTHQTYVIHILK